MDVTVNVQPELDPTLEATLLPLITERQELKAQIAELEERAKRISTDVLERMMAEGETEAKVGDFVVKVKAATRTTLDEMRLVELGVPTETINAAKKTTTGDPFVDVREVKAKGKK